MTTEIWSDLHQNLTAGTTGSLRKSINIESVKTSIDNILGTAQGERVFLPEFASRLKGMLFEPMTDRLLNKMSNEIKTSIERWDDRVDVVGVNIKMEPDSNFVSISLDFNIKSYTETFTHNTTVSR